MKIFPFLTTRSKTKKSSHLDAKSFRNLCSLFKQMKWEIVDDEESEGLSLFNRFSSSLSILSPDEQKLILELTRNFHRISLTGIEKHFNVLIRNIDNDFLDQYNEIIVSPVLAPKDFHKKATKSSQFIWYYLKGTFGKNIRLFNEPRVKFSEDFDSMKQFANVKDKLIILVDDFVGTGKTAEEAVGYLTSGSEITKESIIVLTIAASTLGFQFLESNGIIIHSRYLLPRAISDIADINKQSEYSKIMKSIERKLNVKKKYKFGYGRSEALMSFVNTPNNTFPYYWWEDKNLAPFPRRGIRG
ncbi:MAG: phosphoribosyltransferase [Melioribacteraceae bacterium]|nr:phosphoribosyltransferase [Melioribacteraceae bacterium]